MSNEFYKLRSFDYVFLIASTYFSIAIIAKEHFEQAIVTSGIVFLEFAGGYLLARAYISNARDFLATTSLLFTFVLICGLMAIPESLLFKHFLKDWAAGLTGAQQPVLGWEESRYGMLRAMTVFDHPIHYGVFCVSVFALVWFSEAPISKRLIRSVLIAVATFFSLSAGPLLGLEFVLICALWELLTRTLPHRAWLTLSALTFLYTLVALVSNRSPINILISSLTFDSGSYFYRMLIWNYGLDNVWKNPWVGVSLSNWVRPAWMPNSTIDNFWLITAMWGGIPTTALYFWSIVGLLRAVTWPIDLLEDSKHRRCRYAWTTLVFALCLLGATVHYWRSMAVYFAFSLGSGAWLATRRHRRVSKPLTMQSLRPMLPRSTC